VKPVAALLMGQSPDAARALATRLHHSPLIEKIIVLAPAPVEGENIISLVTAFPAAGMAFKQALQQALDCAYLMIITEPEQYTVIPQDIEQFLTVAETSGAGLVYASYYAGNRTPACIRQVCKYQLGSIRDDFDFGPVQFYAAAAIRQALEQFGTLRDSHWAGPYELRLKVSGVAPVKKIPIPLSCRSTEPSAKHFSYVDPSSRAYQKEMELICTDHLKRIGGLCTHAFLPVPDDPSPYPVEASVIIPVRNREKTIADAIRSALQQKTDFSFNVLVVDNHSTDQTAAHITQLAEQDKRVVRIVPERTDLGIGGCWNVAIHSPSCGKYVCQLDSDDLYADEHALASMIALLREYGCGMSVGTYRVVDFNLQELPPGVVDHREWSDDNGRNNLLRVPGIGAPRAFATVLLRQFPFPNVSYGEDYAVSLRISRDYRVGRIYTPLYLCRRWEDNTDSHLSNEQIVRYATFKDSLRTQEIRERQQRNTACFEHP